MGPSEIVDKIDKINRLFKNPQDKVNSAEGRREGALGYNEAEIAQERAIYVICDASVQFC